MNPYGAVIQQHYREPRNYGSLEAPDVRHEDVNPFCGDRVRIEVRVAADDTVSAARFQGDLCMIAKAAGSILTEMITGMPVARVRILDERDLMAALGAEIQPARRKCALLPLQVLKAGLSAWPPALPQSTG